MKANRNAVLIIVCVLALAALLLLTPELFVNETQEIAVQESPATRQAGLSAGGGAERVADRASVRSVATRQYSGSVSSSDLLASLNATISADALSSLQAEVDGRFAGFLSTLPGSSQRIEQVRLELVAAYGDILAFGAAVERGDISVAQAQTREDPNYVLNQMSASLNSQELTALETYMEEDARMRFLATYAPQMEVVGVELSVANRDRLLETLFTETYLLDNSNGIGAASSLDSRFQRQLDAIANTRDNLRLSMSPEQFAQADRFLGEQERGLLGAQTIFSAN